MKAEAIIVAAGQGKRMGGKIDKIFLEVAGTPIIVHTWRRFEVIDDIQKIIFVIRAELENDFRALIDRYELKKPFLLVEGGKERQDSVWNGLSALSPECEIVTIQDGARPCTPTEIIKKAMLIAQGNGAAEPDPQGHSSGSCYPALQAGYTSCHGQCGKSSGKAESARYSAGRSCGGPDLSGSPLPVHVPE